MITGCWSHGPVYGMIYKTFCAAMKSFNLKVGVSLLGFHDNPTEQDDLHEAVFIGPLTGSAEEEYAVKHTLSELGIRPCRQAFLTVEGPSTVPNQKKRIAKQHLGNNTGKVPP